MLRAAVASMAIMVVGCGDSIAHDDPSTPGECQLGATQTCAISTDVQGAQTCEAGYDAGSAWGACTPTTCTGTEAPCLTAAGKSGFAACDGGKITSECGVVQNCHPGQSLPNGTCGQAPCTLSGGIWSAEVSCNTPLVLAFQGESVEFTDAPGNFDVAGRELSVGTRWVSRLTPWLALDRDGNGTIDDGHELFGSMTELADGTRARDGFAALAALDDDGDGRITARDPSFGRLLLWRDDNQNRRSEPDELSPVSDSGLVAIDLGYRVDPRCTDGDCEMERARFVYRDAYGVEREGDVVDVHFATR
jgi:hypothetical protein